MKKCFLFFAITFLLSLTTTAQDSLPDMKGKKIHFKAFVTTDSGMQKGFIWNVTDSGVVLSRKKRFMENPMAQSYIIPAENISVLTVKNRRFPFGECIAGAVIGFVVTAGVWANEDVNEDGHLSFWELLFGAIDGITAEGRTRRRTAMWVGIGGGTLGLIVGGLANRKLTISFPLGTRRSTYLYNKDMIRTFIQ